ncbi:MAG TPA: hypothetical protein VFZ61_01045 [Polyangiales bacterium]
MLGVSSAFFALGCGGGEYGFARTYHPLGAEAEHFEDAQQPTYQDLIREPNKYKDIEIGWFGVVNEVHADKSGKMRITLSLRAHQARHLCSEDSSSSCRVTVSEASLATFTADATLTSAEISGKDRVWVGSLLKVYGKYTGEYSEETGPVIDVVYHRHWPRGTYVTTAARGSMRR